MAKGAYNALPIISICPNGSLSRVRKSLGGQSSEVLRKVCIRAGLKFVLFLPDGSKSRIPADWTDFQKPARAVNLLN